MSQKLFVFTLLISLAFSQLAVAQVVETEKDSARMYKKIEEFSKKRGFTKFIHGLIFEPVQVHKKIEKAKPRKVPKKNFRRFEGKVIRTINIETLDPFGYSEKNPDDKPTKYLSKFGNNIHIKSKRLTILNLLLFRKNRKLDSLQVKESERLIRSQRYVRAVVITPVIVPNTDSVDVNIRVLDSWSLIPDMSISSVRGNFELTERNFLGTGHQFENSYQKEFGTGNDGYSTRYTIPNIMNTYIRTTIGYRINLQNDYSKSINIERPFFSPLARWAGGAYFDQQFRSDTLPDPNQVFERQFFKYNSQDFWGGHSFLIFKGNTENDRTTNLITTARYLNVNYVESPMDDFDPVNFYSDERLYLGGVGVASRQFVEDKYIFNYGIVEDVPVGRVYAITGGWQEKNETGRLYLGARVSLGKYYRWGYLSSNFEYGTFLDDETSKTEQSAISAQANYFTNLIESGKWKFRQFVKTRLVLGMNRVPSIGDQLSISDQNGIPGFDPSWFYGTKKFITTFQTQAYSPWNFGGFRLNPYFNYSLGILGNPGVGFSKSKVYSQIGAGFIISNDYLVFSNFQLSFAYYPSIPGTGENIFKTNALNTEDFGFQNFELNKPRTVDYE